MVLKCDLNFIGRIVLIEFNINCFNLVSFVQFFCKNNVCCEHSK
jgi:hypothetical protein